MRNNRFMRNFIIIIYFVDNTYIYNLLATHFFYKQKHPNYPFVRHVNGLSVIRSNSSEYYFLTVVNETVGFKKSKI